MASLGLSASKDSAYAPGSSCDLRLVSSPSPRGEGEKRVAKLFPLGYC